MANISISGGLAKAAGAVGLASVAYDAHKLGKLRAGEYRRNGIADAALDTYMDSRSLDHPDCLISKMQDARFDAEIEGKRFNSVRNFFNSAKGYVKGCAESLVRNAVPLLLTTVSLLTKETVSKISAGALTVYGGTRIAKDVCGVGKNHPIK